MVGHFKLKLWAFFWGQGECEWPLVDVQIYYKLTWSITPNTTLPDPIAENISVSSGTRSANVKLPTTISATI